MDSLAIIVLILLTLIAFGVPANKIMRKDDAIFEASQMLNALKCQLEAKMVLKEYEECKDELRAIEQTIEQCLGKLKEGL